MLYKLFCLISYNYILVPLPLILIVCVFFLLSPRFKVMQCVQRYVVFNVWELTSVCSWEKLTGSVYSVVG